MKKNIYIITLLILISLTGRAAPASIADQPLDPKQLSSPPSPVVKPSASTTAGEPVTLKDFSTPPQPFRPRLYWFWMGGSMTKEGIRADMEAMKDVGVGGVLMMNVYPTSPLDITCMGERWWDLLTYANQEAQRNGILFGTHNCPGWSTSGGPWNTVENSMQKVVFSSVALEGPGQLKTPLKQAEVDARWNYYRDIVALAVKKVTGGTPQSDVIDLSRHMDADGNLAWTAPAGSWTIYRFGHTTTGHMNGPPIKGGQGLESDKMSREATKIHFDSYAKKIIEKLQPLVGKTLNNFELDSYEAGKQNWTPKFREEFKKRRGYDPLPWLPVLAGCTLESVDQSARFQRDMDKTISDLYVENHYQYLAELCRENGVSMDYEAYGGPFDPLAAGGAADMPMGECWTGTMGWNTVVLAVSAAHTHGRPVIGCEALTSTPMHSQWKQTPNSIKAYADRAFAMGINMMVLHCYAQQPWDHVVPGMSMNFWGTHFSRTQTWWGSSRPWFDYLARCQLMLQQGKPVVDLLKLSTTAVDNPAGTGYKTDLCNEETLARMTVQEGAFVLLDGMRYRLLLLPETRQISLPALKEIERLVRAGGAVAGPKPTGVPGLTNYPENDQKLQELASKIWGACNGTTVQENRYGKGRVFWGLPVSQVLARLGLSQDLRVTEAVSGFSVSAGQPAHGIEFNHRRTADAEIYFISNQEDCFREISATFRVSGLQPAFYDPETGNTTSVPVYEDKNGGITMPLRLDPSESRFVVFRPAEPKPHLVKVNFKPGTAGQSGPQLEPLRIYQVLGISADNKSSSDLTEGVRDLVRDGVLQLTPDLFAKVAEDATNSVAKMTIDYLVEDTRRMRVAVPQHSLQIPYGVPLSPNAAYEVSSGEDGSAVLTAWQPGTCTYQWSGASSRTIDVGEMRPSISLNKEWNVAFQPNLGAPDAIDLPELHSLSEHATPGVKYYSGTATYEKHFTVNSEQLAGSPAVLLDLGRVKSLAEVILNGQNLGILWKPPFQIDILKQLRAGENHLQVKAVNTWPNRMIGDEQEPDDCQWSHVISWPHGPVPDPVGRSLSIIPDWVINKTPRPSSGRITFCNWKYFTKDTPLLESGLLGPVLIRFGQRFELKPFEGGEARAQDKEVQQGKEPLRIMCLGDSITVGYTDNSVWNEPFKFGYRGRLYTLLEQAGYNFQFVGNSPQPWNKLSGDPTHGGTYKPEFDLRDIGQDNHQGGLGAPIPALKGWLAAGDPDLILLMIGINGISEQSPERIRSLVETIVTDKPDAHLIVAQITPYVNTQTEKNKLLYDYNVYIRDSLVPGFAAKGHKVSTVDMYSIFLMDSNDYESAVAPGKHSNNYNHPYNAGYDLMAERWFAAIEALGE